MDAMSAAASEPAMVPVQQRVQVIDALDAISPYCVIAFNMVGLVGAFVAADLLKTAGPADLGFMVFDLILVQGKARACFALLFGVGFGILMERATARGTRFGAFYFRRMSVLLAIGLCNLAFLFVGDILILYAVLGMVLLLFRGWSNRALLIGGLTLVLLPPIAAGIAEAVTGAPLPNLAGLSPAAADALLPATAPIYRGASFGAYVLANLRYYVDRYGTDTSYVAQYHFEVLGLFLLGLWTARNRVLVEIDRWRPLLRRLAWWGIPVGLVLSAIHATRRMGIETHGAAYGLVTAGFAGLPILAFGYIGVLAQWLSSHGGSGAQRALAPMGRMALTGYLASNAIGSFVWDGWGLGMMGKWNIAAINLFALALFAGLCLFSAGWMSLFRFGPAEWLWRTLTYGRLQPLLRGRGGAAPAAA